MRAWLAVLLLFGALPGRASAQSLGCARLTHVRVGYGSVGVTMPGAPTPGWVIGTVQLDATCDLRTLRLHGLEILDAAGRRIATAQGELELRVAPADRTNGDFSRYGTRALEETVPGGRRTLLWVHARIDGDFDAVLRNGPVRYRLRMRDANGRRLMVEGALEGPWPTA